MRAGKIVALGLVLSVLVGCGAQQGEGTPMSSEEKCEWAVLSAEIGKTSAALAIKEDTKQEVKETVRVVVVAVDAAVDAYCTGVMAGDLETQRVARRALTGALQELQKIRLEQMS